MARNIINNGSAANAGNGDTLRDAADKINLNFKELYQAFGVDSTQLSSTFSFSQDVFGSDQILLGSKDGFVTTISAPNASVSRRIRFPNYTGEVLLDSSTATISNKTLLQPALDSATINNPILTSSVVDGNNNTLLGVTQTASAVNYVNLSNAATGGDVSLAALGTDTNIDFGISAKGTGVIKLNSSVGYDYDALITTTGTTLSLTHSLFLFNHTSPIAATIPNGNYIGQMIKLINISTGANDLTLTPTTFAQGTSLTLKQNGHIEMVWVGAPSGWHLLGDSDSYVTIT